MGSEILNYKDKRLSCEGYLNNIVAKVTIILGNLIRSSGDFHNDAILVNYFMPLCDQPYRGDTCLSCNNSTIKLP